MKKDEAIFSNYGVVTTGQALSDDEMLGVRELWRKVYGREFGWLDDNADPYTDGYHDRSTYYVSWLDGDIPVGTMRIVGARGPGFHITEAVHIDGISQNNPKVVEVQRLMVDQLTETSGWKVLRSGSTAAW